MLSVLAKRKKGGCGREEGRHWRPYPPLHPFPASTRPLYSGATAEPVHRLAQNSIARFTVNPLPPSYIFMHLESEAYCETSQTDVELDKGYWNWPIGPRSAFCGGA